ncbi:MAG: CRISPR-associated protein Cas7 [Candidatus Lokiarchaeota archaeon]|nr:CRISPR-associated protein Cas7 [Candidatus Lokiarchaeota archaeon]
MKPFIYLRGLRHADHTVFCVQDGQKTYFDNQFGRVVAFSSGQQVKRSILTELTSLMNAPIAPITFNYEINSRNALENKEPWSPCDPSYVDQLLGGWMKAQGGSTPLKRRSPLSISAMRPLHPLLAGTSKENLTFDRSSNPDHHPVNVRRNNQLLSEQEILAYIKENNRTLPRRNWIPENVRTTGLFVYDIAIDLRTLFCVSMNQHDPELDSDSIDKLLQDGWIKSENVFGQCIVLPQEKRDKIISALANSLINWRITSNQARTFSPTETLAVAISHNANKIAAAIRAKLDEDNEQPKAKPVLDEIDGAELFVTLPAGGYIQTHLESADALDKAEKKLIEIMSSFDYENQVRK